MPMFTPDTERFAVGRPYALWFAPIVQDPHTLVRDLAGNWFRLDAPTPEELEPYQYAFQTGREYYVTYQEVRDLNLTNYGRVWYTDDHDDTWTDVHVSQTNTPYDRATEPEPVWEEA